MNTETGLMWKNKITSCFSGFYTLFTVVKKASLLFNVLTLPVGLIPQTVLNTLKTH